MLKQGWTQGQYGFHYLSLPSGMKISVFYSGEGFKFEFSWNQKVYTSLNTYPNLLEAKKVAVNTLRDRLSKTLTALDEYGDKNAD